MSILVSDPFDGMVAGVQAIPPGWNSSGSGVYVFAYGTSPPFSSIITGGVWTPNPPTEHQYCWSEGQVLITPGFASNTITLSCAYRLLSSNNTPTISLIDVFIEGNGAPGQIPSPINGQFLFRVLYVFLEEDLTLSLKTSGGTGIPDLLIDNSGAPSSGHPEGYPLNTWYFLQLEVMVDFVAFGGNNYVRVHTARLYIDGVLVCDDGSAPNYQSAWHTAGGPYNMSGVFATELQNPITAEVNWVGINTPGSTNFDLSVFEVDSGNANGVPPNPGNPNVRISSLPAEWGKLPETANILVSQMPLEWGHLPELANIRASQFVIELAHQPVAGSAFAFWDDGELMTTGVNSWTDFGD